VLRAVRDDWDKEQREPGPTLDEVELRRRATMRTLADADNTKGPARLPSPAPDDHCVAPRYATTAMPTPPSEATVGEGSALSVSQSSAS